ncbi:MAG: RluA family pseudouridine synthase [Ruminococcaceae bacterium]|nr:RluA family pseudouridine synthase [Oscillospiraceae bacterium]
MDEIITLFTKDSDIGDRLDAFLSRKTDMTRSGIQKLIDEGLVTINSIIVKKNYKIRSEKEEIIINLPEPEILDVLPENIPLDIIYEDKYLLVVNKPKGMVVHPAPGNISGTLVNALMYHCKDSLSSINGVIRPGIVHRIDKDTSGLLIVAKCNEAHLSLAKQIKEHSFDREYNAIVTGNFKEDSGIVDAPIGRHPVDRKKMAVIRTSSSSARDARTHYEVIERFGAYTYLKLKLETGRTHQIRVHMSSISHPVIGDTVYKPNQDKFERMNASILNGQCLHARIIGFDHPITGQRLFFDSGLPPYFKLILDKLRKM